MSSSSKASRLRLGDLLVTSGIITREQLGEALEYQKVWGHRLGTALVAKKFLTEYELIDILARELRLETADPLELDIHPDVLALVPKQLAAANDLIPIAVDERSGLRRLVVVMADPLNLDAISAVRAHCRMDVLPVIGAMSSVAKAIRERYGLVAAVNKVSAYADGEMIVVHKGGDEVTYGSDGARSEKLADRIDPWAHMDPEATAPPRRADDTTHVPAKLQYPAPPPPPPFAPVPYPAPPAFAPPAYAPHVATYISPQKQGFLPPPPPPMPAPRMPAPTPVNLAMMEELSAFSPKELLLAVIRVLIKRRVIPGEELLDELRRRS